MTINSQVSVGIDVSKDTLDGAIFGKKSIQQFAHAKKGIAKRVRHMRQLKPKFIVVEATGGYEEALVLALFEAGLPVALVSPQRVRHCREAACPHQRMASQARQVGCPSPGGFWEEPPTALVCRQK